MHYFEGSPNNSQVECRHCHKAILIPNYPIHQVRCLQIMKKQQQKNRPQTIEIKPEKRQIYRFQQKKERKEEWKEQKKKNEQIPLRKQQQKRTNNGENDDKIPCFNCGYIQTLQELDSHPIVCSERPQKCLQCDSQFPKSLMREHQNCCNGRHNRSHTTEMQTGSHHSQINDWAEEEPQEGSASDWGGQESYSAQDDQQSEDPYQQAIRELRFRPGYHNNPLAHFEENEDFGYPRNLESTRHRNRLGNLERQSEAIRVLSEQIANLMRNISNRNDEGLNSQEIAQLNRVKYHPKIKEQKDLCTICYCDLQEGETVINLRCNHQYHPECIIQWVKKIAKCPVCKRVQTDRHNESEDSDYDE